MGLLQPGFVMWAPPASHDHFNHWDYLYFYGKCCGPVVEDWCAGDPDRESVRRLLDPLRETWNTLRTYCVYYSGQPTRLDLQRKGAWVVTYVAIQCIEIVGPVAARASVRKKKYFFFCCSKPQNFSVRVWRCDDSSVMCLHAIWLV